MFGSFFQWSPLKGIVILVLVLSVVVVGLGLFQDRLVNLASSVSQKASKMISKSKSPQLNGTQPTFLVPETATFSASLRTENLENPFATAQAPCYAKIANRCGWQLSINSNQNLTFSRTESSINAVNGTQLPFSLFLAKKSATWTRLFPSIQARGDAPDSPYISFYRELYAADTDQSINIGFVAAYYDLLFDTITSSQLKLQEGGQIPVPPHIFAQQYKNFVIAYNTPKAVFPPGTNPDIQLLPWSSEAKALVAVSSQYLHPALVEAMFTKPGVLSAKYGELDAGLPLNTPLRKVLPTSAQLDLFYISTATKNPDFKFALCDQETAQLCYVNADSKTYACSLAYYWNEFCSKTYSPKLPVVGQPAVQIASPAASTTP